MISILPSFSHSEHQLLCISPMYGLDTMALVGWPQDWASHISHYFRRICIRHVYLISPSGLFAAVRANAVTPRPIRHKKVIRTHFVTAKILVTDWTRQPEIPTQHSIQVVHNSRHFHHSPPFICGRFSIQHRSASRSAAAGVAECVTYTATSRHLGECVQLRR